MYCISLRYTTIVLVSYTNILIAIIALAFAHFLIRLFFDSKLQKFIVYFKY